MAAIQSSAMEKQVMRLEKRTIKGRIARRKALRHRSLFVFKQSNSFRHMCIKLVNHASFEALILISIVVSSCLIGVNKTATIIVVDMVLNCIFLIEFIAKIIAYGFILHPGAYLRDPLNVLDASIVLTGFAASVKTILGDQEDLNLLILRLPRIFRPLRLLVVAKELRIVLDAILKSSLALFHVAVFILLLLMLYAIVGLELFSGKLHHVCQDLETATLTDPIRACRSKADTQCGSTAICVGNWTGPNFGMTSFDNIGYSLLTVFQVITLEDWIIAYYHLSDAMGSQWHCIFFVSLILLGAYFSLDLMLGVLTNQYIRTKDIVTLKQKSTQASLKKLHSAIFEVKKWFIRKRAGGTRLGSDKNAENSDNDCPLNEDVKSIGHDVDIELPSSNRRKCNFEIVPCPKAPHALKTVIDSQYFFYSVMVVIALNSICLAASGTKISADVQNKLDIVNIVCNAIFCMEHLLRYWMYGFHHYLEVKVRLLDLFVVLWSMADIIYKHANGHTNSGVSVLRALCLLRLFRGTALGDSMLKMQNSFIRSSRSIFSLLIVLLLTLFIYAMLGNHLFKNYLSQSDDRIGSFADAKESMLLVFVLLTGEGWPGVMGELVDKFWKRNKARVIIPVLYFLSFIVLGNFILLNIFLGIMIENLTNETQEELNAINEDGGGKKAEQTETESQRTSYDEFQDVLNGSSCGACSGTKPAPAIEQTSCTEKSDRKTEPLNKEERGIDPERKTKRKEKNQCTISSLRAYSDTAIPEKADGIPKHSSMFIFSPNNKIRIACYRTATHAVFLNLCLGSIIISTILLAFEDPLNRDRQLTRGLRYCDYLFTGIFLAEILVKIVAFGLVIGHPACYLRDKLNVIDIVVTLISLASLCIEEAGVNLPLQLKVLRVLRVLRAMKISQELRYVVDCLVASFAKIFNYFLLYVSLLFIYSVIGVKLYSGKLKSCQENENMMTANMTSSTTTTTTGNTTMLSNTTMMMTTMTCKDADFNFNHVLNAMVTLFSISTLDNWTTDMQTITQHYTGVTSAATYVFVISFLLVMTFIMLNVFVGFVAVAFQIERGKQEGFCILTKQAQDCIRLALNMKIVPTVKHGNGLQRRLRSYLESAPFEYVILICVTLNCIIMMTKHHGQSQFFATMQEVSNLFFTSLFTIESLLKLFAMSPKAFFKNPWTTLDLLLVIGSWIDITLLFFEINIYINLTVFRLFRAIRIFRVICKTGNLRQILATFLDSIKSVPSIVFLVVLVLYIYAVMGMQLFGRIRLEDGNPLNRQVHFQDFMTALIVLLRTTTLDNWRELMTACSDVHSLNCIDAPTKNCGTLLSYPFYISFIFLSAFMITNLFLAVIMDNFMYLTLDSSVVYCQHIHHFMGLWREFDSDESGKIHSSYIITLIRRLPPPLGFGQHCPRRTIFAKLVTLNIPTDHKGFVSYNELLIPLLLYRLGLQGKNKLVREDILALHTNVDAQLLDKVLPINTENPEPSEFRVFCAANAVKYHFRVFVELLRKIRVEEKEHPLLQRWFTSIRKSTVTDDNMKNGQAVKNDSTHSYHKGASSSEKLRSEKEKRGQYENSIEKENVRAAF